ncbi:hypothetical protein AB1Y20_017342 [Prymnesium parvum]|uniref:Pyroglutamyl-peptidase I n=1 Tax=Prymnesium parvum TaxID=97485 RepID=A0AB34JLE5_PRYPA
MGREASLREALLREGAPERHFGEHAHGWRDVWVYAVVACLFILLVSMGGPAQPFLLLPFFMRGKIQVLVTGFEPFGDLTTNPAQLVAAHLASEGCKAGVCITAMHLPVNRSGVETVADALSQSPSNSPWDAIVHLGYESVSKGLRVEIAAANLLASDHRSPSAPGWSADVPCNTTGTEFEPIDPEAPCLLATTAPLDRIDLPLPMSPDYPQPLELWSRDAGTYYCNEIFYRTLLAVHRGHLRPRSHHAVLLPVLFVHLPPTSFSSVETTSGFIWKLIARITKI